jgi:tetratricopeptide (TPR) repeat protein
MAPEQLCALAPGAKAAEPADGRADLFALGVILYELLTGRHPFGPVPLYRAPADMIGWLQQRHRLGFRPLRELNCQVDRPLARLIQRCLALDHAHRPATARQVADELRQQQALAGRRRLLIGLGGLGGLLFGGAALAGISYVAKPDPFEAGRAAFDAGDYRRAEKCFAKAVEADDGSALNWFALGRARMKQSLEGPEKEAKTKANDALNAFKEAHDRDPQSACEACFAYCHARVGNPRSAILWSNAAVNGNFRTAGVLNNRGFSRLQAGKIEEALADLDEVLRYNPGLQAARYNRALTLLNGRLTMPSRCPGFPGQALEDISLAVRTEPMTADLAVDAGRIHALAALDVQCWLGLGMPPWHLGVFATGAAAQLLDQALVYLRQAVALGRSPAPFVKDRVLGKFSSHPGFQTLLATAPGPAGPQRELCLVDPLSGLLN